MRHCNFHAASTHHGSRNDGVTAVELLSEPPGIPVAQGSKASLHDLGRGNKTLCLELGASPYHALNNKVAKREDCGMQR